jgi:hypothetical protein
MEGYSTIKVKITLAEEALGLCCGNPDVHMDYIASKNPNADLINEEVDAVSLADAVEKGKTVFARTEDGIPCFFDYQIKGFLKDSCGALREVPRTVCSKVKAYKKKIDGLVFVSPRKIPINFSGEIGDCQRPLRADTAMGPRVALANSETVPAGAEMEVLFTCLTRDMHAMVLECLDYGQLRGLGQWRNSGKGRFTYEVLEETGV